MCLATVEEIFLEPQDTEWKVGYKCLARDKNGSLYGPCYAYKFTKDRVHTTNGGLHYYREHNISDELIIVGVYPIGFHIWTTLEDAKKDCCNTQEIIFKVHYRYTLAVGTNCFYCYAGRGKCVVAKEVCLVEEIKDT